MHEISHRVFRQIEVGGLAIRLRADNHIHPAAATAPTEQTGHYRLAAWHVAWEERLAVAHGAAIDLRDRCCLRAREAVRAIGACAADGNVTSRIEVALPWIIDQTVFQAIDRIALRHYFVGDQCQLGRRDRRFAERLLIPHRANREARLIDPRRVGHNAIEILGETLRLNQALASAIGAGIPIGVRDGFTVVVLRDLLRSRGRQVHRAVGVVDRLLRIAQHKRCARLRPRVVARVRLREPETELQGGVALRRAAGIIQRFARVPAVTDHVETAIPLRGQAHLERDLR